MHTTRAVSYTHLDVYKRQLLDPACHLGYLDRSGHTEGELASFREAYGALAELRRKIGELEMDEAERSRRAVSYTHL